MVSPLYIYNLSKFLKLIKTELSEKSGDSKECLPNKTNILKALKSNIASTALAKEMAEYSYIRVNISEVSVISRIQLVWELIDRVLNALVGDQVRQYRSEYLARVNDQKFRTELAIIEEKGVKKFKNT